MAVLSRPVRALSILSLLAAAAGAQELQPAALAPVPVSVLAVPFPIAGATDSHVPLLVEIGGPELLAANPGPDLGGEIRAAAVDSSGTTVEEVVQPFALDPTDERLQRGLKLFAVMRLPPGTHRLRVSVANSSTGATGAWEGALDVPDFAGGAVAVSPPLFPQDPDAFRVFRQSESPHDDLPYPFEGVGGEVFLPAASATAGGDGPAFNVFLYGAGELPQRFAARLVDAGGKAVEVPIEVIGVAAGSLPGQRKLALRLAGPLPAPGPYRLEVSIGAPGVTTKTATALTLLADAPPTPEPLGIAAAPESPPVEDPEVLSRAWTPEALAARYRELLVRSTSEGFATVVPALAETELSATAERLPGQLKALRKVEKQVIESFAGAGGDSLLPVIYLHYLTDAEYLRRDQAWLAAQNRQWVEELVGRWVGRQGEPATRLVAAQLLAALGSSRAALALDPQNELALLRQASSAEKSRLFANAADLLQLLVQAHPESAHGRLRLGVVLSRLDRGPEATNVLKPFTTGDAPRWMAGIAYQELAEIERRAGRLDRAEEVLREGIQRVGTQGLYLQLAYYLDNRQRPDEAVAALNAMPVSGDVESSGRHTYNGPPVVEIAAARKQVEERVDAGVAQLRLALGGASVAAEGSR